MKVIKNGEFNTEVFLGRDNLNIEDRDELEKYLKNVFNKLNKYYDIRISGFYDVDLYIDKNYGIILDIMRDDIDFEPIFNSVDMKITINKESFLYKLDDYIYSHFGNIYNYDNAYYLEVSDTLSNLDMMKLMEDATIVYKSIDEIKKRGKKIG